MMSKHFWTKEDEWIYIHPGHRHGQLGWVHWAQDSLAIVGKPFLQYLEQNQLNIWHTAFLHAVYSRSGGKDVTPLLIPSVKTVFECAAKIRTRSILSYGFDRESITIDIGGRKTTVKQTTSLEKEFRMYHFWVNDHFVDIAETSAEEAKKRAMDVYGYDPQSLSLIGVERIFRKQPRKLFDYEAHIHKD